MARDKTTRRVIPPPLEKDLQRSCIRYLKLIGYAEPKEYMQGRHIGILLVYGTHRRRDDYQGTMQSAGAPDLWIQHVGFVELKRDKHAKVSHEQKLLAELGISRLVYCVDELKDVVQACLERWRLYIAEQMAKGGEDE